MTIVTSPVKCALIWLDAAPYMRRICERIMHRVRVLSLDMYWITILFIIIYTIVISVFGVFIIVITATTVVIGR